MYIDFKMASVIAKALDFYYRDCSSFIDEYRPEYQFDDNYDFEYYLTCSRDLHTMIDNNMVALQWFFRHADTGVTFDNLPVLVSDHEEDE